MMLIAWILGLHFLYMAHAGRIQTRVMSLKMSEPLSTVNFKLRDAFTVDDFLRNTLSNNQQPAGVYCLSDIGSRVQYIGISRHDRSFNCF